MLDLIRFFISLIFAISMMYILLDCKDKIKNYRYLLAVYAAVVAICNGVVWHNIGYVKLMKLYPIAIHLPVFLAFAFLSKFNVIKVFFVHLTAAAITITIVILGLMITFIFGSNNTTMNIACYIIYLPTWFIFYRYIRSPFLYMLHNTDKGWFGFCSIPLSYTALVFLVSRYDLSLKISEPFIQYFVLVIILTVLAYVLILQLFKRTREQLTLQNEQNLLQIQVAAAQAHLESLKESQEQTIIYRHDMRHHLSLIDAYLTDNNKEAAQKYIYKVENIIDSAVVEKYCNNYSVNLILSSYILKARNEGISVDTKVNLQEKNTVSDMDLCIVFSNAIENAVNACKHIPIENDRTIEIICKMQSDKLLIQITNSYEGTVIFADEMPLSTEKNHGIGTKSIAAIAQKYDGVFSFSAENGVFKTSLIL